LDRVADEDRAKRWYADVHWYCRMTLLGLSDRVSPPATSTTLMAVVLADSADAELYVGKLTDTITVPVDTPEATVSVRPDSVAKAAPATMLYTVRASEDMSLTTGPAKVTLADRVQAVGTPIPGLDAALEGLASVVVLHATAAETAVGSVTVTEPPPDASTLEGQEAFSVTCSAELLDRELALAGTVTSYNNPGRVTAKLVAYAGLTTSPSTGDADTSSKLPSV
jgi:hypothetical protein